MKLSQLAKIMADRRRTKTETAVIYYLWKKTKGVGVYEFDAHELAEHLGATTTLIVTALLGLVEVTGFKYFGKPKKGCLHKVEFISEKK